MMNTTNNPITQYYQSIKQYRMQNHLFTSSLFIGLLGYLFIGLFPPAALALTMSNDNYLLQGKPNSLVEPVQETEEKQTPEKKEEIKLEPGQGRNYLVKTGFGNSSNFSSFSFTLAKDHIDYGILSATNPVLRTNILTIISPASGYQVFTYQNSPLRSDKTIIPDTTCDNGACSSIMLAEWSNTLTYGFGYRCDNKEGNSCLLGFKQHNYYKRFADLEKKEQMQLAMEANLPTKKHATEMTYKVNISGTQADGSYINTITYLAAPAY